MPALKTPADASRRVRPQVWVVSSVFLITASVTVLVMYLLTPGVARAERAFTPYETEAISILARQSQVAQRWNAVLDEYNAVTAYAGPDYIEQFNASLDQTRRIVNDSQSVLSDWRALEPDPGAEDSHRYALQAMSSTQYGFILMQDYLQVMIEYGIGEARLIEESRRQFDAASDYWDLARRAEPLN
jgi:hypothetical protein